MYKKHPWYKYYMFHPVEFVIVVFGITIAIVWDWIEYREDQIENFIAKIQKVFKWN